jgi:hypothetical protein
VLDAPRPLLGIRVRLGIRRHVRPQWVDRSGTPKRANRSAGRPRSGGAQPVVAVPEVLASMAPSTGAP